MNATSAPDPRPWLQRWRRFAAAVVRFYHAYAAWLVGISWKRFIVLSVLLLIGVQILQSLPPFRWSVTETIEDAPPVEAPRAPEPPKAPLIRIEPPAPAASAAAKGLSIQIDDQGIRITPAAEASAASAPASGAEGLSISLPPGVVDKQAVREAVQEARQAIREAIAEQKQAAREAAQAAREAAAAQREAARAAAANDQSERRSHGRVLRVREVQWGDFLTQLSLLWVLGSAIVKATYKGRIQAEVKAAQATETAEAESLRRQVVEARMAAMQAQVEPHFLFNTLASIDHLIETDPPRASQMQKNLIALLRASMPTLREASDGGVRELGRELAVIRPYLEILKVRMEERLTTQIDVPDGLLSAEFPPMMIQTLVENAIKHGLEPKPEGGSLTLRAEVVHGKLVVTVADTGLGFGRAATAGTGVGLANVRERLQLLYGNKASLTVAENEPCGTKVTVTVPYKPVEGANA
ncbi:MAG: histidine kinase [Rubrivivax sp. SCN 70-15]|nr:MAG: histidine kinase [Rubrivivax sp. SCN 70-15]